MPQGVPLQIAEGSVLEYQSGYNAFLPSSRLWMSTNRAVISYNTLPLALLNTASTGAFSVHGSDGNAAAISLAAYGSTPFHVQRRANGTAATPTQVASGEIIASWTALAYEGTTPGYGALSTVAQIVASEDQTATGQGKHWVFYTTAIGATGQSARSKLDNAGIWSFGSINDGLATFNASANAPRIQMLSSNVNSTSIGLARFNATVGSAPEHIFAHSLGAAYPTYTATTTGTTFGKLGFEGVDSTATQFRRAAEIIGTQDGAAGATAVPGKITIRTATSAGTLTDAVSVDATQSAQFLGTTDASAVGTAGVTLAGGVGVAKRSFLGTIATTFSGNVLAGVQDATAAVSGQVGEVISSTVSAVAVAATGTVGNITSITLTRGDWDISASVVVAGGATGLTSGSTAQASIVTTTATNGTAGSTMTQQTVYALVANGLQALTPPPLRVNISASTTYFLTEQVTFAAGSPTASATITARRIR